MISICIATAIPLFREGLLHTLTEARGIYVSSVAANSESVLHSCRSGMPEVILLDAALPGEGTIALIRRLQQKGCDADLLLFGNWIPESVAAARRLAGASILSYYDDAETFIRAVHFAVSGEPFISDKVLALLDTAESLIDTPRNQTERLLTATERQILRSLAARKTSKEIALNMFISYRTVQKHRANIARKLQLTGSNALLVFALKHYQGSK